MPVASLVVGLKLWHFSIYRGTGAFPTGWPESDPCRDSLCSHSQHKAMPSVMRVGGLSHTDCVSHEGSCGHQALQCHTGVKHLLTCPVWPPPPTI